MPRTLSFYRLIDKSTRQFKSFQARKTKGSRESGWCQSRDRKGFNTLDAGGGSWASRLRGGGLSPAGIRVYVDVSLDAGDMHALTVH